MRSLIILRTYLHSLILFPRDIYKSRCWTILRTMRRAITSYKLFYTPIASRFNTKLLSTITRSKDLLNCGLNLAKKQISAFIHGPTAKEVIKDVDMSGKTCLITGANSGIGLEMTRCLSAQGAELLMACRNKYAAGQVARADHFGTIGTSSTRVYDLNLASLRSVSDCCEEILNNEKKIDIVLLNAAVFGLPWTLTEDMLETTFQVNYLSQLYLLMKIDSILAPDARVVFVSSESHRNVSWSIEDQLMPTESLLSLPCKEYTSIRAYNISKLCGLLAMHHLGYKWMKTSKSVFSAHPGSFVKTRLCRNWWVYEALYSSMLPFSKTIAQAASTPLYCAVSPDLDGLSAYYYKDLRRTDPSVLASDLHLAFRIYDLSREMLADRSDVLPTDKVEEIKVDPSLQPKVTVHENLTPEYSA